MQAEAATMHDIYLQDGGHEDQIQIIEEATAKFGTKMKTAVAAAAKENFVLSIFDDTYILIHKGQWDACPSLSRFGTLGFEFHANRQQCLEYAVGIVSIADGTDERKWWETSCQVDQS